MNYNEARKEFEKKWQSEWEKKKLYEAKTGDKKPKFYGLIEFPYPSGAGMHVGHIRSNTAMDIITRKRRMEGFNVLYPIGWDAFGLPTENYAIKMGIDPAVATKQNTDNFRRQLKAMGFGLDWEREIDTTDPEYYKWTQWMFLKFFEKGLAYKAKTYINWCPKDKIGLANEEAAGGVCDRCGGPVEKREKEQWMIAITKYADRLLEGLKDVDYIPQAKTQQENWIGRSEGAEIDFKATTGESVKVFTTRADTIFGATYIVLAPEHWLIHGLINRETLERVKNDQVINDAPEHMVFPWKLKNLQEVIAYVEGVKNKSEEERLAEGKEKTGVELKGIKAINPATKEEIPVWVADYVLATYGTGAIMAVPAHDERDFEFAKKYKLPIKEVIVKQVGERLENSKTRHSVRGICIRDGKLLITFDKKMQEYILPGGGIDNGESSSAALLREIREETGYTNVRLGRYLGSFEHNYFHTFHKNNWQTLACGYEFEILGDETSPRTEKEIEKTEILWLPVAEAIEKLKNSRTFARTVEFFDRVQTDVGFPYIGEGTLINSGEFTGTSSEIAKRKITEAVGGKITVKYKLRDWVFSRQRYWGEPIPLIFCPHCAEKSKDNLKFKISNLELSQGEAMNPGWVAVPEKDLPVKLPKVEKYQPTDTGESPLSAIESFVNVKCPKCKKPAKRETDTMPNWAGSSWYFLRYCDTSKNIFENRKPIRKAIKASEKDLAYFNAFKKIYSDLEAKNISTWTVNRFLLNGINGQLWLGLKTVALMAWESDIPAIFNYLKETGHKLVAENKGGHLFDKDGIRVEIIPIFKSEKEIWSFTLEGKRQDMKMEYLPVIKNGELFDFRYCTVSPQYNLLHYKDIKREEDKEKIEFLEEWIGEINDTITYWMPVDWYNGGMEHTVLHLLYSRFWNMFLYDLGLVPTSEPYKKRTSHGMVLAADGSKMSKSLGNVINPDDIIAEFGTDSLRMYEMFMGPFNQAISWDPHGILGCTRFLEKVWNLSAKGKVQSSKIKDKELEKLLHKTIKKVSDDIESMSFNTAISAMMVFMNEASNRDSVPENIWTPFLQILAPFAPHLTEELYLLLPKKLRPTTSIHVSPWPAYDASLIVDETFELIVQVNGKVRDKVSVPMNIAQADAEKLVTAREETKKWLTATPRKVIFVPNRLINFIV